MRKPAVNIAVQAARKAGTVILRNIHRADAIAVSDKGQLDFVTDADRLAEQLIEAFRQTNVAVMDFTRVDFIDSVGMKALMTVLLHCRKTEGVCVLHGVSEDIMSVFVITRLNKLLPITGNLEEALGRVRDLVAQSRERVGNMKA